MTTDEQLLRAYLESRSETAFAGLVQRHVDLVYSTALRRVEEAQWAQDLAQAVFVHLARKAGTIRNPSALSGWLYRVTCDQAANAFRTESRRRRREREAVMMTSPAGDETRAWAEIEPLLDEAMRTLAPRDQDAIILRFFRGQSLRQVGEALALSEDAAQKCVSRAIEKLRAEFARRGVTATALALSAALSAKAVSAAPAGLAATLSTSALAGAAVTAAAATAAKTIVMSTLQKAVIGATLAVVAGAGLYQVGQASRLRKENKELQQARVSLTGQIQQLERDRDETKRQLAGLAAEQEQSGSPRAVAEVLKLRGQVTQLRRQLAEVQSGVASTNDPFTRSVLGLVARAAELNRQLEQMPEKQIPELHFLGENDWLNAAKGANFDTEADIRKSLRRLRNMAKFKMPMGKALSAFTREHGGELPTELSQLKPYLKISPDADPGSNWSQVEPVRDSAILDAILDRYKLVRTGNVSNLPPSAIIVIEKAPVDREYDSRVKFGIGTSSITDTGFGEAGDPDDASY